MKLIHTLILHTITLNTLHVTQPNSGKERVKAAKLARQLGITLTNECPWIGLPDKDGFTPFIPDGRLDNIYQSLPQVTLHGMDEGLTLKLCDGVLQTIISEAIQLHGMNVTSVRININQYIMPLLISILMQLFIFCINAQLNVHLMYIAN